jgi:uncharacterized protein (TIGR03118 family)
MRFSRLGTTMAALVAVMLLMVSASTPAHAASYKSTFLTADQSGIAPFTDPNLINPWGISFSPTGPFWVSDNNSGKSTLYDGSGTPQSLIVTIPPASGTGTGVPTGTVYNATTGFVVKKGTKSGIASFLFDSEDGVITGWSPSVDATNAIIAVDASPNGTVYKGMELAVNGGSTFLYTCDFFNAQILVYDSTFKPVTPSGNFMDPNLPSGYAPHNIRNINGRLYVAYAKQNATKTDAVPGRGFGFVSVFDVNGNFLKRLVTMGPMNAPWGLALAPSTFGTFANQLLIGNLGDGKITAVDRNTGALKGQLKDSTGKTIALPGLWGLQFGNGGSGGSKSVLYFTSGPGGYGHGRFGSISFQ